MAILDVLQHPDPRLRSVAEKVRDFDEGLKALVDDMLETVDHHEALGLSSTQVDARRAVLVLTPTVDTSVPRVWVNPELLGKAAPGFVEESCLSIPDVSGNVIRSTRVLARGHDVTGADFELELSGMDAVCLQHEMDHLVGKLFIDRLSIFKRLRVQAALRKRERDQTRIA